MFTREIDRISIAFSLMNELVSANFSAELRKILLRSRFHTFLVSQFSAISQFLSEISAMSLQNISVASIFLDRPLFLSHRLHRCSSQVRKCEEVNQVIQRTKGHPLLYPSFFFHFLHIIISTKCRPFSRTTFFASVSPGEQQAGE